ARDAEFLCPIRQALRATIKRNHAHLASIAKAICDISLSRLAHALPGFYGKNTPKSLFTHALFGCLSVGMSAPSLQSDAMLGAHLRRPWEFLATLTASFSKLCSMLITQRPTPTWSNHVFDMLHAKAYAFFCDAYFPFGFFAMLSKFSTAGYVIKRL